MSSVLVIVVVVVGACLFPSFCLFQRISSLDDVFWRVSTRFDPLSAFGEASRAFVLEQLKGWLTS
jgi:hypothetical protein